MMYVPMWVVNDPVDEDDKELQRRISEIKEEVQRKIPEIKEEVQRKIPEIEAAIRRLHEAQIVTREVLDIRIDI